MRQDQPQPRSQQESCAVISTHHNPAPGRNPGPPWKDELLARLHRDPRFSSRLRGVAGWDAVPPGALPHGDGPARPSLGYFTSSSTGAPKRVCYSNRDWEDSVRHRSSCLAALGLKPHHLAAVLLPFGPWFSGDNISQALLGLGARVLPAGLYGPHRPAVGKLLKRLGANAVITTPSVAFALTGETDPIQLDVLVLVGETLPPALRPRLKEHFGAEPRCLFAASEAIIGPEETDEPGTYTWDPDRLCLEVMHADGTIGTLGEGELLVTCRYGEAMPLLRYPLGDRVEILGGGNPRFLHLGRIGHGFSLATGVKMGRAQLDRFLDGLDASIHEARFDITHGAARDQVAIALGGSAPLPDRDQVRARFVASSLEVSDAFACGYLNVEVSTFVVPLAAKRRLRISETPWRL